MLDMLIILFTKIHKNPVPVRTFNVQFESNHVHQATETNRGLQPMISSMSLVVKTSV